MNLLDIKRELCKRSLYEFVLEFWSTYETVKLETPWFVEYYCELFMWNVRHWLPDYMLDEWIGDEAFYEKMAEVEGFNVKNLRTTSLRDKSPRHLNINIAPRHMKSSIFNILGPVWLFTLSPVKVASVSHKRDLSSEMNINRQKIIRSEKYKEMFPERTLITDSSTKLVGDHNGVLWASTGAGLLGFGADIIIIDDLVNAEDSVRDMQVMANAINFYQNTLPSRLNDPRNGIIMNIQQRLAPGDITGFIQSKPELSLLYEFIEMKAISMEHEFYVFPCSGKIKIKKKGEGLWETRHGDYSRIKASAGMSKFETQYQQEPRASDDTIIKEEMIQYMKVEDAQYIIDDPDYVYASHDFSIKETETSDLTGSVLGLRKGNKLLIIDAFELKMGYIRQKEHVLRLDRDFHGIIQIVEDKANGSPLIEELQGEVQGIVPYQPGTRSKSQRLELASDRMSNVYFVVGKDGQPSERITYLIDHLLKYPFLAHDDVVDAFSQLVNYTFSHRRAGLFSNNYDDKNVITSNTTDRLLLDYPKEIVGSLYRVGMNWKGMKAYWDPYTDTFYIIDELTLQATDVMTAVSKYKEFFAGCKYIMDASEGSVLSNTLSQSLFFIEPFDDRPLGQQLSQLQAGFSGNKILIGKHCIDVRRDIDFLTLDKSAEERGIERLNAHSGYIQNLIAIIYMVKGDSDFYS